MWSGRPGTLPLPPPRSHIPASPRRHADTLLPGCGALLRLPAPVLPVRPMKKGFGTHVKGTQWTAFKEDNRLLEAGPSWKSMEASPGTWSPCPVGPLPPLGPRHPSTRHGAGRETHGPGALICQQEDAAAAHDTTDQLQQGRRSGNTHSPSGPHNGGVSATLTHTRQLMSMWGTCTASGPRSQQVKNMISKHPQGTRRQSRCWSSHQGLF